MQMGKYLKNAYERPFLYFVIFGCRLSRWLLIDFSSVEITEVLILYLIPHAMLMFTNTLAHVLRVLLCFYVYLIVPERHRSYAVSLNERSVSRTRYYRIWVPL